MTIIILHTDANAKMMILLAIASTNLENVSSPQEKKCQSKKHMSGKTLLIFHRKTGFKFQETSHQSGSQCVFNKKRYASGHRALFRSEHNKRERTDKFCSLCIVQVYQIYLRSYWKHLENS